MIRPADERMTDRIGLRGDILARHAGEWSHDIEDVLGHLFDQGTNSAAGSERLVTLTEDAYPVNDPEVASRLGVLEAG